MENKKTNVFWNNDKTKFIMVVLLALLLIMISIVLFEDIRLDNSILIINIFGTLSLIGFLYSYALTKKNMYKDLSLGYTRKEIFFKYLRNIFIDLGIAVFLVGYYISIYRLVINTETELTKTFDFQFIAVLPLIFLSLSFLGFFFGLLRMKRRFFYSLVIGIFSAVVLLLIFYSVAYLFTIFLLIFVILFGATNYLLLMNCKI